jgi:hypothetical protein
MNTPGRAGGNWGWRYRPEQLDGNLARGLRSLTDMYGRGPVAKIERGTDPFDYTVDGALHSLH